MLTDPEDWSQQTPEQHARCRQWFDERNELITAALDKCMDAERENIAATVKKFGLRRTMRMIEEMRKVPYPRIEHEGVEAIRKWIDADNHYRACHALAYAYEEELVRQYMPHLQLQ